MSSRARSRSRDRPSASSARVSPRASSAVLNAAIFRASSAHELRAVGREHGTNFSAVQHTLMCAACTRMRDADGPAILGVCAIATRAWLRCDAHALGRDARSAATVFCALADAQRDAEGRTITLAADFAARIDVEALTHDAAAEAAALAPSMSASEVGACIAAAARIGERSERIIAPLVSAAIAHVAGAFARAGCAIEESGGGGGGGSSRAATVFVRAPGVSAGGERAAIEFDGPPEYLLFVHSRERPACTIPFAAWLKAKDGVERDKLVISTLLPRGAQRSVAGAAAASTAAVAARGVAENAGRTAATTATATANNSAGYDSDDLPLLDYEADSPEESSAGGGTRADVLTGSVKSEGGGGGRGKLFADMSSESRGAAQPADSLEKAFRRRIRDEVIKGPLTRAAGATVREPGAARDAFHATAKRLTDKLHILLWLEGAPARGSVPAVPPAAPERGGDGVLGEAALNAANAFVTRWLHERAVAKAREERR